jgi:drug/metabolite transporter (DMT)-like permease
MPIPDSPQVYGSLDETTIIMSDVTDDSSVDGRLGDKAIEAKRYARLQLMTIFVVTILLGPLNFVLYRITYAAYGKGNEFFVSNMVNAQYVIFGQVVLMYAYWQGQINPTMNNMSMHGKIRVMALLDALAGFLAAMGAVHTTGAIQQLLNQSLIPFTMIAGWIFLEHTPTLRQVLGAVVIFCGAGVVLLPHIMQISTPNGTESSQHTSESTRNAHLMTLMASVVYASSNIPMSASYTYKEHGFKNLKVHVIYLTQWVSIYQLVWGFLLLPLQQIPGLGSENGLTLDQSVQSLQSGWRCFTHENPGCAERNAMGLLTGYILTNFAFNLMGLYLVKHGSSVLNAISYAIILPLTVISFTLPILGAYQEEFNWDTIAGLVVVLLGFFIWRSADISDSDSEDDTPTSTPSATPVLSPLNSLGDGRMLESAAARERHYKERHRTRSGSIGDRRPRSGSGGGTPGVPGGARRKRSRSHQRHLFSPKVTGYDADAPSFQERTIVLSKLAGRSPKLRTARSDENLPLLLTEMVQPQSLP